MNFFNDFVKKVQDTVDEAAVFIQDGKRYINDDTQLDKTRPYQQMSGGSSRFVAPPSRDISWDSPNPDEAERIQSPAPPQPPRTLEENTQRFREIDRSIVLPSEAPAAPVSRAPVVPDYVTDDAVQGRFDRAVKVTKPNIETYFGNNFAPGASINESLIRRLEDPNLSTQEKIELSDVLEKSTARDIIHEVATATWEQLDPRSQEIFVGAAVMQAERFTAGTKHRFENLVSSPSGRAEMFANMLDYVLTSKSGANDDLVNIYQQLGLVNKRTSPVRVEVPITRKDYSDVPFFGRGMSELMKLADGVLDEGQFNNAILGLAGMPAPIRSSVQVQAGMNMKEIINSAISPSDDDIDMLYKVKDAAPVDTALFFLDADEAGYLRGSHPELAELPMDTFLQTLSVNPRDVGVGQSSASMYPRLSLEQRAAAGLLTPAESLWFGMGLSQDAINHLNEFIYRGGSRDISNELRQMGVETRNYFMQKTAVLDWITANPQAELSNVPRDLIKNMSAQDLLELGFPADFVQENKGGGSIPVISGIFNGINWAMNALDSWHDREATRSIGNPTDGFNPPESIWSRFRLYPQQENIGAAVHEINKQLGTDFSETTKAVDVFQAMTHPDFQQGGKYDRALSDIFNSPDLTSEEHEALEDVAADLADLSHDDDGLIIYPGVKLLVDMVQSGMPVTDAIEQVSTWRSTVARAALGWDMMLMPFGGLASKGINAGVRNTFKIGEFIEQTTPTLRGLKIGTVVNLADEPTLVDDLVLRLRQVETQLEETLRPIRTIRTGSSRGLGTVREAGFVDEAVPLTDKATRELVEEAAEIKRILTSSDDVTIRANIFDPAVLPKRYATGDSLTDIFQVYNPIRRAIKATDGTRIGDVARIGIRGADNIGDFFSRLMSGDALRGTEFAQRASVINDSFMVSDQMAQIFRQVPRGSARALNLTDEGQTFISRHRDIILDMANAGRNDTVAKFVRDYSLNDYVTDRMYKTVELVGNDIDVAKMPTLNFNTRIALNEQHYDELLQAAIERISKANPKMPKNEVFNMARGNVYRSEQEWFANFMNDFNGAVSDAISNRVLGKPLDEVGGAIKVQDMINGALSMFMLESPGFVIRNVISNLTAGVMDGLLPWQTFGRTPSYIRKYAEQFGIDPLSFSFSPKGLGVAELRTANTTFARELFRGNWKGGGIPGIGGIPHMYFRQASAHFEAVNRSRIVQQESSRFMTQMWNEQSFMTALRHHSPEAGKLLDELAATGASSEEFYSNLYKAVSDYGTLDLDNVVRYISNITGDGKQMALSVDISPVRIAEELGFHTPHLNADALTAMREVMSSYDPSLVDLASIVNRSNREAIDNIKKIGEQFGVPGEAVDDIVDVYDVLFHSAKQAGMTPKDASDFALNVSTASSFRLRGIYERNRELLDYVNDPEIYRNAIFPYANGIQKSTADVADLVRVPTSPYTRKGELFQMLDEEDEMLGWKAASDIIDQAKQLKSPVNDGGELSLRIQRTVDNLSQLRQAQAQYSRPTVTNLQKAQDAAIEYHNRTFDVAWPAERKNAYLKSQILRVAEMGDAVKISSNANSNLVRVYLTGAKPAEVRRAINELIEDGTLATRYIEGAKSGNRYVLELADEATGKPVLLNPQLGETFKQYVEDITFLADQVAEARIADMAPSIRSFNTNLNRSRRKTIDELKNGLMNEMANGNVDPHALTALANSRLDAYATRTKERFNEIADKLDVQRAPIDADRESWLLGRYYGENSPSFFTQTIAENVPTISFYRDMVGSEQFTSYGRDKFAAMRTAVQSMQAENAAVTGQPFFNTVLRQADPELYADVTFKNIDDMRLLSDEANASAKEWARNVRPYHEYTLPGWKRTVSEPLVFAENAPIAQIPDGVNVVPANFGMAQSAQTPGVPTRGVWGRTFMQQPPDGFRAVITTDDWASIGLKGNRYGTRFALFVRNGTSEEEFLTELRRLANQHYDTKLNKQVMDAVDATGRIALRQNPSGFYASFQIKSASQVTDALKPMLKLADEGDEIAQQVVQYARAQWRSGWPIAGHPQRTLQDVYDNFARSMKADLPFGNYYTLLDTNQGKTLIDGIKRTLVDKNQTMNVGMSLGQGRADWILHNYNNVNDLDFLMRWLGPWHIWPTRTMGKLVTRIIDNPQFYVGYKAFDTALEIANSDLPEYMRNNIPVDWALQGLQVPLLASTIGMSSFGLSGTTLNANSMFFFNDLIGDYSVAGEDATWLGRFYDKAEDYLPLNPAFGWGMSLTGQFGSDKDLAGELERIMRPLEIASQMVSEVANWADAPIPNQVILSERDINDINLEYAVSIMEAVERGDRAEIDKLVASFDEWGRSTKGGLRLPILQYVGAGLGVGEMDATTVQIMRNASRNRVVGNATSYLLGHKLSLPAGDRQKLWDAMDVLRETLSKSYKTDAERGAAINAVFDDPKFGEALSAYLRNNNDSSDLNTMAQAESLWFAGLEDINNEFDTAFAGLRSTANNVTSEENAAALTKLYLTRTAQISKLAGEVENYTGINPQTDENFSISYRVNAPELQDLALRINMDELDAELITTVVGFKGMSTPILDNIDLLAGGEDKTALIAEVNRYAAANDINPKSVTIGQLNLDRISTEATSLLLRVEEATTKNDLYLVKDGQYTNAIDFEKLTKAEEEVMNGLTKGQQLVVTELRNRSMTPAELIDKAIYQWVREKVDDYYAPLRSDVPYQDAQIAFMLEDAKAAYKPPTNKEIMDILDGMTQGLWRNNNDISESELIELVGERIKSAEKIGDLNTILTTNYDDNIGSLAAGLGRLAELQSMPQTADTQQQIRELTGYTEDGRWHAGTLRHFTSPNGYVITNIDELNEFREAYATNQEISKMYEQGVYPNGDITDRDSKYYVWAKYFKKDFNEAMTKGEFLNHLSNTNQWQLFDQVNQYFNSDTKTATPDDQIYNPDGSIRRPEVGVKSAGRDVTRIGGNYRFPDLGTSVALSRNGAFTKAYLERHFTGAKSEHMPPDYLFELLAQNGVTEESEIMDFFWSVYEMAEPMYGEIFKQVDDVAFTLFSYTDGDKGSDGRPQVSTYQYLLGLRGMYDTIYGRPSSSHVSSSGGTVRSSGSGSSRRSSGSTQRSSSPSSSRTSDTISRAPKLPKDWSPKPKTTPTTRGLGGMPEWKEATNYIQTVFHDSTLLEDLVLYFSNNQHRMTNNHMRMLRSMYQTFPIGSTNTFSEWLAALKLMFNTSEIVSIRTRTIENPADYGDFNPPRFAKYR